jgi:hypothetical protein
MLVGDFCAVRNVLNVPLDAPSPSPQRLHLVVSRGMV